MKTSLDTPGATLHINSSTQVKLIRDYTFHYSEMDISIPGSLEVVYPRIGYLVFCFLTGTDSECRFLNYNRSVSLPHHLYITGLFSQESLVTQLSGTVGGIAMNIHPVIGYYFLRVPLHQLTDKQLPFSQVVDQEAHLLRELEADLQIHSLDNPYLKRWLEKALPDKSVYLNDPIYHAVNTIIRRKGHIGVKELASQYSMSERTLNRQFLLKVGLSPQAYAKIWQLQHVMKLLQGEPNVSLAHIAYEAGYYDVAHLARDFRHKVSLAPSRFNQYLNNLNQAYLSLHNSLQ